MEIGKIYKFYGQFECGDVVVGKFDGTDETTGFFKFSNIVKQKNCSSWNRVEIISEISKEMKGQAVAAYEKFVKDGVVPKGLVLHNKSMYNADKISQVTEMENYFKEV